MTTENKLKPESCDQMAGIEVMARLTGTNINCAEICSKWVLITYDIPIGKKGDQARRQFLDQARMLGATCHTESVYLMPWTPTAEVLALELAKIANVCFWTSEIKDEIKAREITKNYDEGLEPILDTIKERLDKMANYLIHDHYKQAERMLKKTDKILDGVKAAIVRRGSAKLFILVTILEERLNKMR